MTYRSTTVLRQQALKISDMLDTLAADPEPDASVTAALEAALYRIDTRIMAVKGEDEQ